MMRKTLYSLATLGVLGLGAPAMAMKLDVPKMLMQQAYGNYNARLDCWETTGGQMTSRYCMKPRAVKTVKVQGIPVSFLLVTGFETDGPAPKEDETVAILKKLKVKPSKKSPPHKKAAAVDGADQDASLPKVEVILPNAADAQPAPAPQEAEAPKKSLSWFERLFGHSDDTDEKPSSGEEQAASGESAGAADGQAVTAETEASAEQVDTPNRTNLIGMFVYTGSTDEDYQLIAQLPRKDLENPEDVKCNHFVRLGPNRYGWMFDSGYSANGFSERWMTVYSPVLGVVKDVAKVQVYSDDSGAVADKAMATVFDGEVSFAKAKVYDGFYALSVKMRRQFEGKELPAESYEFRFNKKQSQYMVPKNYPLTPQ